MTMLRISHVNASYGSHHVLKDISFELQAGQGLSILGPNGCGKTTLLRAIASLIPFQGEITINDKSIRSMKRVQIASQIALMSQISKIYFTYSVFETVMFGRYHYQKPSLFGGIAAEDRDYALYCLEMTGLSDMRHKPIDELSGGQLQRVFLAQTLAQDPQIILLDEPTNHLDLKNQVELIDYLREWVKKGDRAIIGVFHDINLALRLSENTIFMKDGMIMGDGQFTEIVNKEFLDKVYGIDVIRFMKESFAKWDKF